MLANIDRTNISLDNPIVYTLAGVQDSTRSAYKTTLERVSAMLGFDNPISAPWEQITPEDWFIVRERLAEDLTPSTLNKYLSHLRGLITSLFELNMISTREYKRTLRSLAKVKQTRVRKVRALSLEELEKVKGVLGSPRDKALFGLLFYAGLRLSEAVSITWDRVNLEEGVLLVLGKGNREDWVPLHPELIQYLEALPQGEAEVLFSVNKAGVPGGALSPRGASKIVSTWVRDSGVPPFSPHDLRRTLATQVYNRTGKLGSAQVILRHQNLITTQNYIMELEAEERKREALESILDI